MTVRYIVRWADTTAPIHQYPNGKHRYATCDYLEDAASLQRILKNATGTRYVVVDSIQGKDET